MANGAAIVIEGTREDWPGGPRTLTPFYPNQAPDTQVTWFGAELAPDDKEVWFRITLEAVHRMEEQAPGARGNRLVDALLAWISDNPDYQLEPRNNFRVVVDDSGTRIEPSGD